ncbi:hypothetical protein AB9K17_24090, partial [Salmonella enterica subsp. enterica serovar Kentucky]|uniref:hypothetical protein n=1 Tax=Salmonella enterica TaxID=28901 RepID=UPI003F4B7C2B
DNDIHRFHELLDMIDRPVNTNDYVQLPEQKSAEPTFSVVEVHQPRDLASSNPGEATLYLMWFLKPQIPFDV